MLKKVFINITKQDLNIKKLDDLCEQCRNENIKVQICNRDDSLKKLYQYESEMSQLQDCVLVTDVDPCAMDHNSNQASVLPILGVGLDYAGNCTFLTDDVYTLDLHYLEMVYARFYHQPLVLAQTEHLLIREMSLDDLDQMYELYQTLSDCSFIDQLYERAKEEQFTKNYIEHMYGFFGYGLWLVIQKEDNKLIGRAGIENREIDGENVQELGYLIGKPWQNRHYATETCEAILAYAKEQLSLNKLYLCTHKQNIPSISLAHKLGFKTYAEDIDGMNIYDKNL